MKNYFKVLAISGLLLTTSSAFATAYSSATYDLTVPISSVAPVTTIGTLTLIQNGLDVDFTLYKNTVSGFGSDSFFSQLDFSYVGTKSDWATAFSSTGSTQTITELTVDPNGKNAGYDFFLSISFPSKNSDRFLDGDTASWTIQGASVADFTNLVSGNSADSAALVHVQGITGGNSDSYKYLAGDGVLAPVPEADTWAMMLAGLGLVGFMTARRTKSA